MGRRRALGLIVLAVLVLTGLALALLGFGEPPAQTWRQVTTGQFSGAQPISESLGTFNLAGDLLLAWTLTGPADARATFRLQVARIMNNDSVERSSTVARSWSSGFSRSDDMALFIGDLEPGEYHVTLSQRFGPGQKSGLGGTYRLYIGTRTVN
jgi:hypothetical protein